MKKGFLFFFILLFSFPLFAEFSFRWGLDANFPISELSRIGDTISKMNEDNISSEDVAYLKQQMNSLQSSVRYGIYSQLGWDWSIFQLGGEGYTSFNIFRNFDNTNLTTTIISLSPRIYLGMDLFLMRLSLLSGMSFDFMIGSAKIIENYLKPKFDLGLRLSVGPLMTELIGVINTRDYSLSLLKVGIGFEFIVF